MKDFLKKLEIELRNKGISETEINEILEDHKEMIEEAFEEGLTEEELYEKFGSPNKIAEEMEAAAPSEKKAEPEVNFVEDDYQLFKSIAVFDEFNLHIELINEDLKIVPSDTDEIKVFYKGKGKIEDYECSVKDQTVHLKKSVRSGTRILSNRRSLDFMISLPKENIDKIILKSVNADFYLEKTNAKSLVFSNTNGDFSMKDTEFISIEASTVNGDIHSDGCKVETAKYNLVNGDVNLVHQIITGKLSLNGVSGDFQIDESECEECFANTVSGDVSINEFYPKKMVFNSLNGDIDINNQDESKETTIEIRKTFRKKAKN